MTERTSGELSGTSDLSDYVIVGDDVKPDRSGLSSPNEPVEDSRHREDSFSSSKWSGTTSMKTASSFTDARSNCLRTEISVPNEVLPDEQSSEPYPEEHLYEAPFQQQGPEDDSRETGPGFRFCRGCHEATGRVNIRLGGFWYHQRCASKLQEYFNEHELPGWIPARAKSKRKSAVRRFFRRVVQSSRRALSRV